MNYSRNSDTKHGILKSKFKKDSEGYIIADELYKNYGKYDKCCNPYCKTGIGLGTKTYMAFDGIFCSILCQKKVEMVIFDKWSLC